MENFAIYCIETYEVKFRINNSRIYTLEFSEKALHKALEDFKKDSKISIVSVIAKENYYKTTPFIKALREIRNSLREMI